MSKNRWILASLALAGALGAGAVQARDNVYWSIGINAPLDPYGASIGTTISNGPVYRPAPVYVQPAPVYYGPPVYVQPRPVYVQPRPIYVQPRPVYVQPAPIVYDRWGPPGHGKKHWKHHHHHHDQYYYGPISRYDGRGWRHGERD